MKLYLLHIDDLEISAQFDAWLEGFPEFIQQDIISYKKAPDRWRVLAGKLLLKYALRDNGTEVLINGLQATPKGRLFFKDVDFDFNISHSGKLVLLGWSSENKLGVDVEMHRKINVELFRRNFSDGEWQAIITARNIQTAFFKTWAAKESIIKADGRGVEVLSKTEIFSAHKAVCDGKTWWYQSLELKDGYATAVACLIEEHIHIRELSVGDLQFQ